MGDPNIYTVDENGHAAMRITTQAATVTDPTSIYGTDEEGNAAVRVVGVGGGGGGDGNYNNLSNKPKINGVTLSGNKTAADLGIKGSVQIAIEGTATVEGYSVPKPTAEEMAAIYNAIVAGNNVQIVDTNDVYYQVLQADSIDGAINIEALYFGELSLLYTLENDTVTVTGKKLGGGSEPTVETITGNTPTIANVQGNHIYNCTGTLTSLTLTAVETTYAEATIYFTAGASITVDIPASVKTIGYTEFSANTSYIVSFANNTMVIGEINA